MQIEFQSGDTARWGNEEVAILVPRWGDETSAVLDQDGKEWEVRWASLQLLRQACRPHLPGMGVVA